MVYRGTVLALLFCCGAVICYSQKVKYKDLFLLLNSKQYDVAEPFLKKFLKDNPDHANGLLYMGIIYQEKSNKEDVIKQTELAAHHMDSAVIFYEKALKEIDEKEIKRNDEYYESYKRRDMRTGEFAVKYSDVQYDIDKRIQGLKERKSRVFQVKQQLTTAEAFYGKAVVLFQHLQGKYSSQLDLLLQSNDSVVAVLTRIEVVFDSSTTAFKSYKSTSQLLGKTGYNQIVNLQPIKEFKKDGINPYDFLQDDLKLWDFKTWAQFCLNAIEKEIRPLREGLVTYDMELNKLSEHVKKDSVDVRADLARLVQKSPAALLKKNDPDPLPAAIFDMKIAEINYGSELSAHKKTRDSVNVAFQLRALDTELKKIAKLDSITSALAKRNIDEECINYKGFVTSAYGTTDVLKNLIKTTADFAAQERLRKQRERENKSQALKWLVVAKDSIPLFADETISKSKFRPLLVQNDEYTLGLHYADSLTAAAYFYTITPSRIPDVKASFPLDKVNFAKRNLPILKGLATKDEKGLVYFGAIFSEGKVKDKFVVVVAKIYRSDGLSWSKTYSLELMPSALIFDASTGELSIKTANAAGEIKMVALDKNGKQVQ